MLSGFERGVSLDGDCNPMLFHRAGDSSDLSSQCAPIDPIGPQPPATAVDLFRVGGPQTGLSTQGVSASVVSLY